MWPECRTSPRPSLFLPPVNTRPNDQAATRRMWDDARLAKVAMYHTRPHCWRQVEALRRRAVLWEQLSFSEQTRRPPEGAHCFSKAPSQDTHPPGGILSFLFACWCGCVSRRCRSAVGGSLAISSTPVIEATLLFAGPLCLISKPTGTNSRLYFIGDLHQLPRVCFKLIASFCSLITRRPLH